MTANIEATIQFVKDQFQNSYYLQTHPYESSYRLEHTFRVANIGLEIAKKEQLDWEAMTIACLLHDVSYATEFHSKQDWLDHGRTAVKMITTFLETLKLSEQQKQDIRFGIAIHVDGVADFPGNENTFELTVSDADNIDRYDAYRVFEGLKSQGFDEMDVTKKREYVSTQIIRMKALLQESYATKTATAMLHLRANTNLLFFQQLDTQLNTSTHLVVR